MKEIIKKQLKKTFVNRDFISVFILLILSFILYFVSGRSTMVFELLLVPIFYTIVFIGIFFSNLRDAIKTKNLKNGEMKYEPYRVSREQFIEECKMGLMYSIVQINGEIYELSTLMEPVKSSKKEKFTGYINETEIIGLDNYLNYKYDGTHCLNELKYIDFLECNESDPRLYFEEHIV